jgi:hypothetical protein
MEIVTEQYKFQCGTIMFTSLSRDFDKVQSEWEATLHVHAVPGSDSSDRCHLD